jgi:MFS transporter, DHA1 family, solute carrier family 18 (vesicular amine transporter), member 1/2
MSASRRSRSVVAACVTLATFTDLVAYSVAVPILPDYASRFGADPTTIGLLFASFGVTLLAVSLPMGAVSDRLGRKGPLVLALALLALSTALFAYATSLAVLFAARMLQGAADAVTWVVGLALVADLYRPEERGRVMGLVMSGTGLGLILGPSLGGWLYEIGGIRLPFLFVSGLAVVDLVAFAIVTPSRRGSGSRVPVWRVLSVKAVAVCAVAVVAGAATIAMLEPVLPLFFEARLGLGPAAIGTLFGVAALASSVLHPIYGRLSDRWGGKRLMLAGLVLSGLILPILNAAVGPLSAALTMVLVWGALNLIVTPSLAFMAEAASAAGLESHGVAYGIYNVAWAVGLMGGPSLGGFLLEHAGFGALTAGWAIVLIAVAAVLASRR